MTTSTKTVTRGDFVFTITVAHRLREPATAVGPTGSGRSELVTSENIVVSKNGNLVDSGRLELFTTEYMRSRRYEVSYYKSAAKPVGRIGSILIGPDAATEISAALNAARSGQT